MQMITLPKGKINNAIISYTATTYQVQTKALP